jgi:hypothetical protein
MSKEMKDDPSDEAVPRVLGVRFGVNPNSSSLGVDVTYLLFGGAAAVAASLFLSAWIRGRKRRGEPLEPATASAPPGDGR